MARVMVDFASYVSERPSMDQIAQQLVLSTLSEYEPRAALVYEFHADGIVNLSGAFGLPSHVNGFRNEFSIWDETPAVDAIRLDRPIHIDSAHVLQETYAHLSTNCIMQTPLTVWPLRLGSERIGALQVHFVELPKMDELKSDMRGVSTILGLYLGLLNPPLTLVKHPSSQAGESSDFDYHSNGRGTSTPAELTSRQLAILRFLITGMTNRQIANRIGFSDSTVRQETMAIYRFLNVGNRREAAQVAIERNIIASELEPTLISQA